MRLPVDWPSENNISTGPASIVRAEVELQGASQTVTDYWRLVYAAERHNLHVRYWVVLDPPLDVAGIESPVHAVEVRAPEPTTAAEAQVMYLGESFEVLATQGVLSYNAQRSDEPAEGLRDFLSELLYRFTVERKIYGLFEPDPGGVRAGWESLAPGRHAIRTELKAVTYHQLEAKQETDGWSAQVIFDV